MGWFKRVPLHERLLAADGAGAPGAARPVRDADRFGEAEPFPQAADAARPDPDVVGIHGVARRREWDAVVTAQAPDVRGDSVRFVTLEGGDMVVEDGDDSGDLTPLADAVEVAIDPPYRAQAVRKQRDVFAVGAQRLEIASLPDTMADTVTLTVQDGSREIELDGDRVFGGLPALERIGERVGRRYVVRAERVDGPLFEVRVDAL